MSTTDRIEKNIVLRAPLPRVWRALADAREFGQWFRLSLDGPFVEGQTVRGAVTYPGYEHLRVELSVDELVPEKLFSYRWHPYPNDPKVDYSLEPMTRVEFRLEAKEGGTALTIVESGFDRIPLGRRAEALRMNDQGWSGQVQNIERHVAGA
ncbi:MAG TPA: SRPBCC family protein [Polyangiaceae bacterium]